MNANPEQSVLDAIDALVDEQMAGGEIAAERRAEVIASDIDRCALCKGAWHGTPWTGVDHDHLGEYDRHSHGRALSCPGAFATGPQRIRYRWRNRLYRSMRRTMGREQAPLQRFYRHLQAVNEFIEALTEGDPALQEWQREQRARWLNDTAPNLPPEIQFPRPMQPIQFPPLMSPVRQQIPDHQMWFPEPMSCTVEPVTLPKLYMAPGRGGRQSVTHPRPNGLALLRYWGSPQTPGDWWELDGFGTPWGPWVDVEVTYEQDEPPRRRQGRGASFPPLQRVFIELTTASGLRVNPIGLIAVGHGDPGASGAVRRAYLKSTGEHPPLLYDDNRRASTRQPTSWRRRGVGRMNPERLVPGIREAFGL
ncbi:Uncharacterised protein [Mycobacteroides abscessus subsp. abscessus]|uniref:hypothetical protein n=1 Tax=Mycobacteroides abscessus TaxID=36809 RepID=UPI000927DBEF|nr:hypothetical protein [Mycobacteroides abscessus]SII89645.1 Uncharacterised protein [Mycobacteroides abscessus subsp. abscessus]SIL11657.1 Uncharacterised protein [Mycobacteroides abscessus subsp. abscessus]SLK59883.1 Uncharacterised protein [Mycobacteroides abscessus subsp. abscessus]